MSVSRILVVVVALAAAIVALVVGGRRVLQHDREELLARYTQERRDQLEHATEALAADLSDIGEDLELAATLLEHAETPQIAERELHSIATIKREYFVMDARADSGETAHVVALDIPAGLEETAREAVARTLAAAPGDNRIVVSDPLGPADRPDGYRVFARHSTAHHFTIAVLVDLKILLSRFKLEHGRSRAIAVYAPDGRLAPTSDALPSSGVIVTESPVAVDGGQAWRVVVAWSTQPLEDEQGRIVRRVLAGTGLVALLLVLAAGYVIHTARRAAALRERLRTIDYIPSGMLMLADDRRITGANRWFVERAPRGLVGADIASILDGDSCALVAEAIATRRARSRHRTRLRLFGHEVWVNAHAIPLDRGLADASTLFVVEDLTELRRIEERLLHSEKLVTAGQLAAGIAHEIGTPLNVARARVELVMEHLGDRSSEQASHQIVLDQIDLVTRLIQQLLDYVRADGRASEDIDVRAAMESVRDLLHGRADKRGISVRVEGDPVLSIRANPDQIQQVLVNLVLNAIDACARGGHVTLSARRTGDGVALDVTDDGAGIAPDVLPQVFDPFFTTKKRGQGTGLGLWVVAQIVRAHDADIRLDSTPGGGTTARVTWPEVS